MGDRVALRLVRRVDWLVVDEVPIQLHDAHVHGNRYGGPVDGCRWSWRDVAWMGTMKLTVLGSNASAPSRSNPASGYLLDIDGFTVLMDCGPGVFMRLAELMDPGALDAVILSHTHVDHCSDVLALYSYLAFGMTAYRSIPVYSPEGTKEHLASFARAGEDHVFHEVLDVRERAPGQRADLGPAQVTWGAAIHPVPALVSRIEAGSGTLVFSGDTGPGGDLLELAQGASLLLSEASLQGRRDEDTYGFHLTAADAGDTASWAGAGELVLTHIPASLDPRLSVEEAEGAFAGLVSYAAPGTTFEITTMG